MAAAVLVSCWRDARNTGQDGDGSLLILLSIFVPIGIWCMGIAIGLLVQASRNNIRHYLTTYATTDYSETRDLILNLSRLIADIDSSAPPADRKWLLEQATEALTQAVLLKKQFERPAFHRPMYMIFQILCAPFFIFTVLPLSLVIGCAGLDETPRIDGVYQEGLETAMVDRFSLGCCVHISGLGCCCGAAEDKWLAKVAQRSQSLEAQNWGSLSLHSL